MKVKAEGDGYHAVYTSYNTFRGWCFISIWKDYLTPGIGFPMYYPTEQELFDAVSKRKTVRLKILEEIET